MVLKLLTAIILGNVLACSSNPSSFSLSYTNTYNQVNQYNFITGQDATIDLKSLYTTNFGTLTVFVDTGSSLVVQGHVWQMCVPCDTQWVVDKYAKVSLTGFTILSVLSVGNHSTVHIDGFSCVVDTLKIGNNCTVDVRGYLENSVNSVISLSDGANLTVSDSTPASPGEPCQFNVASAEIAGEVEITGGVISNGAVKVDQGSILKVSGKVSNAGKITVFAGNSLVVAGSVTGTAIEVRVGKLVISQNATVSGSGTLIAVGDYTIDGVMEIPEGETHVVYPFGVLYYKTTSVSDLPTHRPVAQKATVVKNHAGSLPRQALLMENAIVNDSKDFVLVVGEAVSASITGPLQVYGYATHGTNRLGGRLTLYNPSDATKQRPGQAGLTVKAEAQVNMKPSGIMVISGEKASLTVDAYLTVGKEGTLIVRSDAEMKDDVSIPDYGNKVIVAKQTELLGGIITA